MSYKSKITGALKNQYVHQYVQLLFSTGAMMVLQFLVTMLLTNYMPTADFGEYKKITNTLLLFQSLFLFGWPFTISFLIVRCGDDKQKVRKYIGAGIRFIFISVIVVYCGLLALFAVQAIFNFVLIPFCWGFYFPLTFVPLLQYYLEYICMGTNQIKLLSIQKFFSQLFMITLLLLAIFILKSVNIAQAIFVYGFTNLLVLAFVFFQFHPYLNNISDEMCEIHRSNRSVGLPTYIGGLCSVASVRLVTVIVSLFTTKNEYAFFSLAVTIASPLGPLISSLGSILYKKFSLENKISSRFLMLITTTVICVASIYVFAIDFFTPILFGKAYSESILFAQIIGVGSLLTGFADVFNRFLGSKGEGKAIQHGAIATGTVNLVFSSILLPVLGALGASVSRLMSNITYFVFMVIKYKKFIKSNKDEDKTI